jgi:hypothetical protein
MDLCERSSADQQIIEHRQSMHEMGKLLTDEVEVYTQDPGINQSIDMNAIVVLKKKKTAYNMILEDMRGIHFPLFFIRRFHEEGISVRFKNIFTGAIHPCANSCSIRVSLQFHYGAARRALFYYYIYLSHLLKL